MDTFLIIDKIALGKPAVNSSLLRHFCSGDKRVTLSPILTPRPEAQAVPVCACLITSVSKLCLGAPSTSASKKLQGEDDGKFLECIIPIAVAWS